MDLWRVVQKSSSILCVLLVCLGMFGFARGEGLTLTAEEKLWLSQHPVIRLGSMNDWPPLNFTDKDGRPQGIGAAYVAAMNKRLNGAIVMSPAPFSDNYGKVLDGQIDALMDISHHLEREAHFNFTRPYISIPHVLVGRKDGKYFHAEKDLAGKTVGLERGFYNVTHFSKNYPEVTIREFATTSEALDAVTRGAVDAYAGNRAVAIHLIEKELHNNLQLMGKLEGPRSTLQIGVAKNNPLLVSILDKALNDMSEEEQNAIQSTWTAVRYEKGINYPLLLKVVSAALLVILLFVWWNRRLGKEIRERKRSEEELSRYREQLEDMVRERSRSLEESESRYRSIVENMQDVYYRSDAEGCLIMISPSGAALLGYDTPEQMLGMVIRDTFYHDPDDRDAFISNLKMKGALAGYEVTLKRKDGTPLPVATSTHLLFDADGDFCGVEGVFRDISEQRRSEEALRASEEKFSKAFSQAPLLMSITDAETGRYLAVNDRFCQVTGYSMEEAMGRTSIELGVVPSAERERLTGILRRDGRINEMEITLTAKDGHQVVCLYSVETIQIDGGDRFLATALDITQRKSDLVALDYANECFQQALSGSQHILYRLNVKKAGYDYLSPVFEQITGYPLAEFMCTGLEKLAGYFHPEDRERVSGMVEKQTAERSGRTINFDLEYRFRKADGSYCWLHDLTTACFDEQGELECFFGSAVDVTERKGTEEQLRESEERYRILFNAESDAIVLIDAETLQHIDVNDSAVEMYGYSRQELLQIRSTDLSAEPEETSRCITEGQGLIVIPVRYHRKKDGTVFPVEIAARFFEFGGRKVLLAAMRDISEIQRLQRERDKAQRLESLGLLAGGIAHDFNNILTGIIGNLSLIRVMIDSGHRAAARLDECEKAAIRAGELTQQLLTFARGGEPVKKTMDVVRLIEESVSFTLRGSNVKAELDIAHDLWAVEADEGQINQVLNNLMINAVQAMPGGGVVTVRAENETGTKSTERHVCISIRDSGDGIPDEILPRIFDPYFSTKAEGTGLGLASVYSIVTRHGGSVTVSSEAGYGSEFVLRLPAAAHPPALEQVDEEQHPGSCPIDRVLVMDDEAMIRDVASLMLSEMGCGVDTCADGREALELYRAALTGPAPYNAVILDLTVPGGMGGLETAERILALDPLAVLIVSSGYSQDAVSADFSSHGFSGAVMKPYTMEMISAELGRVVASRRSSAATL